MFHSRIWSVFCNGRVNQPKGSIGWDGHDMAAMLEMRALRNVMIYHGKPVWVDFVQDAFGYQHETRNFD